MPATVVIPSYQSADTVAQTVRAARRISGVAEVVVVDDGSRDETARAAEQAGADHVISLPQNKGKGDALRAGVQAARHQHLLFLDADLGDSAAEAGPLLDALRDGPAMAIAVLPPRPDAGGLGLALGLAAATIRLLGGIDTAAPMSGQRAIPASLAKHIGIAPRFGVEVALTVEAAHLGIPVVEVPLPLEHERTGRTVSGFIHRGRQLKDALRFLLFTGYGLGWPALTRRRTIVRIAGWLFAFALLVCLGIFALPMGSAWLAVTAAFAAVLWLPTLWISAISFGLRRPNYLGRRIPAASGLLFPIVGLSALWFLAPPGDLRTSALIVIAVFGAVGFLDDVFGARRRARGLSGHLLALARGRLTTGVLKALGGIAAGLAAGLALHPGRPGEIALTALLIALTANLINLLDLRPGRALKGFGLLSVISIITSPSSLHLLGPLLAAGIVSAPADLAGRTMMGDVGANVLGGAAGLCLALVLGPWQGLLAVLVLLTVHLACERISLSDLIARSRLLSFLDRLGTAHLSPFPAEGAPTT